MLDSPDKEWRRLSEHYAGMYEGELLELARGYKDLTEMAQQVLRDEMKKRGLGEATAPRPRMPSPPRKEKQPRSDRPAQASTPDPRVEEDRLRFAQRYATMDDEDLLDLADDFESLTQGAQLALTQELERRGLGELRAISESQEVYEEDALSQAEARVAAMPEEDAIEIEPGEPHDYTWKVPLGEYGTREEAWQRAEMLRRAGIERWYSDQTEYRILVPADHLEEAERIIAHPVPADIVEQSQMPVPEFEMPKCPSCRAADPVLMDTAPSNKWLCEACGREWTDPEPADARA